MAARSGSEVMAIEPRPYGPPHPGCAPGLLPISAAVMDAARLALPDARFDAALSVFGVILCPGCGGRARGDGADRGAGGPRRVVTWTEPQNYA